METESKGGNMTAKKVTKPKVDVEQLKVEAYTQGFFDALTKYGVLSKMQRNKIKDRMLKEGIPAGHKLATTRFSVAL